MEEAADPEATVYGRFKADVMYDTRAMNGASTQYVKNVDHNDSLGFEGRESRVGVKFSQGESLSGCVEVDFYGGTVSGTVEDTASGDPEDVTSSLPVNKGTVLLRQMWVKAKLSDSMSVLVGQTGDVFSPLLPSVMNYGWGWNCGNPGYRRPQVRFELAQGGIVVQAAGARSIGDESAATADWQGRIAYVMKDDEGKTKLAIGASGVQGFKDPDRHDQRQGSALDVQLNLGMFVIKGEMMVWGKNLKPYLAGIAQEGVLGEDVRTQAGWVQLGVNLDKLSVNVGYLFDDPNNGDVAAITPADPTVEKYRNWAVFLNVRAKLNSKTQFGFEVMNWNTLYNDPAAAGERRYYDNIRYTASLIFKF